jgi:PAS domain S-box-containing protein
MSGTTAPEPQQAPHAREDRQGDEQVASPASSQRTRSAVRTSEARYRKALEVTQEALASAEALYRVVTSMAAAESLDALLQRIVDTIAETLPADRVNLFTIDAEARAITGNYRGGPGGGPVVEIDFDELSEGLGGWVLREGVTALSPAGVRDPREPDRVHERRTRLGHGSMIVAPMIYHERHLGIIVVTNRREEREFDQDDADLLSAMAGQSAISIESAAIREQLRSARDELEERVRQRTAELAESEERYRRITETITDYVFHVDLQDGRVVATRHSPASAAVTGYSPEEFDADPHLWLSMVVPEDQALVLEQAREVESGLRMRQVEHRVRRKDGAVRWVRSTPVPQYAEDGRLIGYDGILQDITETRTLQDELAHAQKMESIGRLAGGVAHDFNNLLTAILGNAELAALDLEPGHPALASISEITKAAEGAARLTRQLLSFARRQMIEPVPLDLNEVVEDSLELVRRLLGEDVDVTASLEPSLGIVEADPGQIQQVLVNLTVNARDAMPEGGQLVIETANEIVTDEFLASRPEVVRGRWVSLSVTDTGQGMPAEVQAHLFEPFFTTKPQGRGTGLGLATCHGIVKQSGGHIWIHSEVGQGTRVTILLPECRSQAPEAAEALQVLQPARGTETILIVEDEPSVRRLGVLGLRSLGYTVLEAANAAEALRIAATEHGIALVVSDVIMPGMRGPELAARMRKLRPKARVLLTSGHTDAPEGFRDAEGNPIPFVSKPFTPDRLAHKVRAVLDGE